MNLPQVYMCSPSWTLRPPPSPFHPSGSSQCTSPKHPVSCIKPGLATRFILDILHVSMPFSQIFPPSPSPTESIRLLLQYCFCSMFCFFHHEASGILASWPGIELTPPALEGGLFFCIYTQMYSFIFKNLFLIINNCFTMLCWFLPFININQL